MTAEKFFPSLIIMLSIFAAIAYAIEDHHNWRMILYWTSAATLNYAVTW